LAISIANKDSGSNAGNTPIATTTSVAYQNSLLYLATVSTVSATAPTVSSIAGGGMTWVRVNGIASGNSNCELWRGLVTSGATTGVLTFTLSANPTNCAWSIDEVSGMDTSGTNGSGAIVQSANGSGVAALSGSVTLAAFGDATNNVAFGSFFHHTSEASTIDADSGYAALTNAALGTNTGLLTEWKIGQDLAVDASWVTSSLWRAAAAEIKAAPAIVIPSLMMPPYRR